jgi:hypothetical protein
MPRLTPSDLESIFATNWKEKTSQARARLANLEHFEQKLFDRLNETDLPEGNRDRIIGWSEVDDYEDGGLIEHVGREIRSLLRSLPLWHRNGELVKIRLANLRAAEATAIHKLVTPCEVVPRAVRQWITESSASAPEALC